MTVPKLKIKKNGDQTPMTVGYMTKFEDSPSTSVSVTPIVTYPADSSFAFDTSSVEKVNISLEHIHSTDQGGMTNKAFLEGLRSYIDRWQAKTDGNLMTFDTQDVVNGIPQGDDKDFYPTFNENVYLNQISTTFVAGRPEYIKCSIGATVGSMYCKEASQENGLYIDGGIGTMVTDDHMFVTITSSDGYNVYPLYIQTTSGESYTCIDSYKISCGPMTPFPMISMRISKKRLANIAPNLVGDIIAGKNLITVNAAGKGTFLVTKCSLSGNTYRMTGYALEEAYRGLTLNYAITCSHGTHKPMEVIDELLKNRYDINNNITITVNRDNIYYLFDSNKNDWSSKDDGDPADIPSFQFTTDMKVWDVIQICALKLNAQVFFMEDKVMIIDPTLTQSDTDVISNITTDSSIYKSYQDITYLNTIPYESLTPDQETLCRSIVNSPSLGDEGSDTLYNKISITYGDGINAVVTDMTDATITGSKKAFGTKRAQPLDLRLMKGDCQSIADNYMKRLCDTQQSISFTIAERSNMQSGQSVVKCWHAYFPMFAHLNTVIDHYSDTYLTNKSSFLVNGNIKTLRNKLALSNVERSFPEFTSTYKFGAMANADLTQTTSQILGSL